MALLFPLLAAPATAAAQVATVSVERENFRAIARGMVVAELERGTPLTLGGSLDRWREATLEAWIWAASVREEPLDGHDLVVSPAEGENLRASPNGPRIGRARPGMRLSRVETEGKWVRVRRTGWIWGPSLDSEGASGAARGAPSAPPPSEDREPKPVAGGDAGGGAAAGAAPGRGSGRAASAVGDASAPGRARAGTDREILPVGAGGLPILSAPGGDTLARVAGGGAVEVLGREGDWTRVRVEGWTLTGSLTTADSVSGSVLRDIGLEELQADPERVRGRLVEWTVQFIALQQAERFRTDFLEGEAFLLARGPADDPGFVYIAVPSDREPEMERLVPLDRYRVVGRVRTARSRLTDAPVIDLLEIRPVRR